MPSSWDAIDLIIWGAGFSPADPPPRDCLGHKKGLPVGVASAGAKGGGGTGTLSIVGEERMAGRASSAVGGVLAGVVSSALTVSG